MRQLLNLDPKLKVFLALNCCHRVIELVLSHQIFVEKGSSSKEHNLFALTSKIVTQPPIQRKLIRKLFAANIWTEQTHTTYFSLRKSDHPIPPLLQKLVESSMKREEIDELIYQVRSQTETFIPSANEISIDLPPIHFPPAPRFAEKIDPLIKMVHSESTIFALLQEFKKDYDLLIKLEESFSKSLSSKQFSTLLRYMTKLHHALPQHLLQALYYTNHFETIKEHNLVKLIDIHPWKTPISSEFKDQLHLFFQDMHHLSNYPFAAQEVKSPLHQLILEAEIYRADPLFYTEEGFNVPEFKFGVLKFPFKQLNSQEILMKSRDIINHTISKIIKELSDQLSV